MCGIHLTVWGDLMCSTCQDLSEAATPANNLRRRGPDTCRQVALEETTTGQCRIVLQASVLQMREDLVPQPVAIHGNEEAMFHLCWNGEVYQALEHPSAWDHHTSDTQLVASLIHKQILQHPSEGSLDCDHVAQQIATVMGGLYNAEFAFLLLSPDSNRVYYGRDSWGRRSLLRWDCPNQGCSSFQIASTAEQLEIKSDSTDEPSPWDEIAPGLVHQASLRESLDNKGSSTLPFDTSSAMEPFVAGPELVPSSLARPPAPNGVSEELWNASFELEHHLSNAVAMRMDLSSTSQQSTAVLFSGGLDSAVVAALAAKHSQKTLTLYNVSFGEAYEKSADRQAALLTHQALQEKYSKSGKDIVFEDIVVSWEDICRHEPHVRTLLQPKTTLMDVNIATALWFASRGCVNDPDSLATTPRILLLGMGADEQLGGYGRHRKAFQRGGWDELQTELEMDQNRFWERNLGRDDRICADHGKEARFPFLDAHVTHFLKHLPLQLTCDFDLPPGQGDKRILRLVAMRLGLDHASGLVKRAIQFGSRISHVSDAKRFGSRRKAKGERTVVAS